MQIMTRPAFIRMVIEQEFINDDQAVVGKIDQRVRELLTIDYRGEQIIICDEDETTTVIAECVMQLLDNRGLVTN